MAKGLTSDCKAHGRQPMHMACPLCVKSMVAQNRTLQSLSARALKENEHLVAALKEARGHLLSAAADCERFATYEKRLERRVGRLVMIIDEIKDVTHTQYCVNGPEEPLPAGVHHMACIYLREMSADEANVTNNEELANVECEEIPETTVDNRSVPVDGGTVAAPVVDDGCDQSGASENDAERKSAEGPPAD